MYACIGPTRRRKGRSERHPPHELRKRSSRHYVQAAGRLSPVNFVKLQLHQEICWSDTRSRYRQCTFASLPEAFEVRATSLLPNFTRQTGRVVERCSIPHDTRVLLRTPGACGHVTAHLLAMASGFSTASIEAKQCTPRSATREPFERVTVERSQSRPDSAFIITSRKAT
jgi:hypothetical protein